MNEHIQRGNDAMRSGDYLTAMGAYRAALEDPDAKVRDIAQNRLDDIELDLKPVWTAGFSHCYHAKLDCPARNLTNNHFELTYWYWFHALCREYEPCPICKPPQNHLWRA